LRESYSQAGSIVIVLAAGYLGLIIFGNPQYVLTMTGYHRAVLAVNCVSALVLVIAGVAGALRFGAVGLAVGSALSFFLQNGILWWLAHRELGIWTHIGMPIYQPSLDGATTPRVWPRSSAQQEALQPAEALSSSTA
jgi:O-antigen/teichoic acid export membrane protein